jgi:hypothetical protein
LWITYAWADNEEGDFDFLVTELGNAGVAAKYDKIALVPGRRLWEQIGAAISFDPLSGWAYLVTPNSLASQACREELSYALQRALEARDDEFPLIGLLQGVSIRDVPIALRVRLCVNLANPDWIEEVRAGVAGVAPRRPPSSPGELVVKVHANYLGQSGLTAIEIRPRFGELRYWRWAFPKAGPQPKRWGTGPAGGRGIGSVETETFTGEFDSIGDTPMSFVGAGSPISAATSAYAVFDGALPTKCFFGTAIEAFGAEATGSIIEFQQ